MPTLTFPTLKAAQSATTLEFVPALAKRHHFVRSSSGAWCRTLGEPENAQTLRRVGPRVWHTR